MNKKQALEILKNNPVFWSRLGFCYDPPLPDEKGQPLVFQPDFTYQLKIHDDFSNAGIKIHTCILHSGWVGVNKYDYSLCDKVLEGIFKSGKTLYFIPRIKLNVPIDWCRENPEEVFVYENGPQTAEEIRSLAGTLKQDYLGYESPKGYYNANGWQDTRPNIKGLISLQSFCSQKWLDDAGEALKRLINHLEASPYADRILAYHIAYGACGESMPWGRQSGRFGDYGICSKKHFLQWAIKKYGSLQTALDVWGITERDEIIPPSRLREKSITDSSCFYKDEKTDIHSVDYDEFMSEVNVNALCHFSKIVKDNTDDKPVGAFYGYLIHMARSGYAGHLGFEKLMQCKSLDFFAAPKSYFRCAPGEPGGEMTATVTVNRTKLWVDECDNRTHLTTGDNIGNAKTPEETYMVQLREFCKNISHDSGLWYMDLGGGWYDDKGIMKNIASIVKASEIIRKKKHESRAEIIVIVDEKSVMLSHPKATEPVENFLRNLQLCGAPIDIIYSFDIADTDFSHAKTAIFLTPLCIGENQIKLVKDKLGKKGSIIFVSLSPYAKDFVLKASDNTAFPQFFIEKSRNTASIIKDEDGKTICAVNSDGDYLISSLNMSVHDIRTVLTLAGVHFYAPQQCAVYADNRIVSYFPRQDITFVPCLEKNTKARNLITGEYLKTGEPIHLQAKSGVAFIIE